MTNHYRASLEQNAGAKEDGINAPPAPEIVLLKASWGRLGDSVHLQANGSLGQ
jgi:hypothetical protein